MHFLLSIYFLVRLFNLQQEVKQKFDAHFIQANQKKTPINPRKEHFLKIAKTISASTDPQLWRLAIIDMDIMLEEAINERFRLVGEIFGEKLKNVNRSRAPWLDAVWEVHRLRNILAHEGSRYHLTQREAFRSFKITENLLSQFDYFK